MYKQIKFKSINKEEVKEIFLKEYSPYEAILINIINSSKEEAIAVIETISQILKQFKINPHIPYPIYILNQHLFKKYELPTVRNFNNLPSYFFSHRKSSFISHEKNLMRHNHHLADKLHNQNLEKTFEDIKKISESQKEINFNIKEIHQYEIICNLIGIKNERSKK